MESALRLADGVFSACFAEPHSIRAALLTEWYNLPTDLVDGIMECLPIFAIEGPYIDVTPLESRDLVESEESPAFFIGERQYSFEKDEKFPSDQWRVLHSVNDNRFIYVLQMHEKLMLISVIDRESLKVQRDLCTYTGPRALDLNLVSIENDGGYSGALPGASVYMLSTRLEGHVRFSTTKVQLCDIYERNSLVGDRVSSMIADTLSYRYRPMYINHMTRDYQEAFNFNSSSTFACAPTRLVDRVYCGEHGKKISEIPHPREPGAFVAMIFDSSSGAIRPNLSVPAITPQVSLPLAPSFSLFPSASLLPHFPKQ